MLMHILQLNMLTTVSWILCFQHVTCTPKTTVASKMDKKKIGIVDKVQDGANTNANDLYRNSHDSKSTYRTHRKHEALLFPVFFKRHWTKSSVFEKPGSQTPFAHIPLILHANDRHSNSQGSSNNEPTVLHSSVRNPNLRNCDEKNVLCNICSRFVKWTLCMQLFLRSEFSEDSFIGSRFTQRKLLQEQRKETTAEADSEKHQLTFTEEVFVLQPTEENLKEKQRMEQLSALIEELRRDVSKEPMWAMISVAVLILVLVLVSKACGLRTISRRREIHVDVENDFHNVDVMEVLRVKKRYLPKSVLRFKHRLHRKFRRKPRKIKEKDICEPLSDTSGEERLLYDDMLF